MTMPTFPQFPAGLSDDTKLPFELWRVMNLVDGRRDLDSIARTLGIGVPMLQDLFSQVEAYLKAPAPASAPASQPGGPLTDAVIDEVGRCLVAAVGPMGEVMLDEALDELDDEASLPELLGTLMRDLGESAQNQFFQRLRQKGLA